MLLFCRLWMADLWRYIVPDEHWKNRLSDRQFDDLLKAIREKLFVLPPWTKVLSGHTATNDDRGGKQMQSVSAIDYDWINSEQDHL